MNRSTRPPVSKRASTTKTGMVLEGRYAISGRLGAGGMARVYDARDLETQQRVAIKILEPDRLDDSARFRQEADVAKAITHPNIVRILGAGERVDGRPYIVMEHLQGETLGDYLTRHGTMSLPALLGVARDVASGLAATHAAGFVHRDVKPENIVLVGDRDRATATKLIDFGFAETRIGESMSNDGFAVGTMSYMAPEQVLDDGATPATDVYGLGVVLFRALTGHLPFEDPSILMTLGHQVFSVAPPVTWIADHLSADVERLIAATLRKRPENRYPGMQPILDDLARLAADPPEPTRPPDVVTLPDAYEPRSDLAKQSAAILRDRL